MKKKLLPKLPAVLLLLIFNSCLGLSTDIQMRRDGSGRITIEYRISGLVESIGRLDGNEHLPFIPVGRVDWERGIERLEGIRLVSFSSRERSNEIITRVTLDYDNMNALLKFLDPNGTKTSYSQGRLDIILIENISSELNPDLLELMRQVSSGYKFTMSFNSGSSSPVVFTDGTKKEIPAPQDVEINLSGRKVSFSIDIAQLFSFTDGFGVSINF